MHDSSYMSLTPATGALLVCIFSTVVCCTDDAAPKEPWNLGEYEDLGNVATIHFDFKPTGAGVGGHFVMVVELRDPEMCVGVGLVAGLGNSACQAANECIVLPNGWRRSSRFTRDVSASTGCRGEVGEPFESAEASQVFGRVDFAPYSGGNAVGPEAAPDHIDAIFLELRFDNPPASFPERLIVESTRKPVNP